ncbi:hypothetical protein CCYA_CCYA06G1924 [Cyanidiococcus yangmingshanensis]|nr:hypothetical protein CCYA_CCYA06G1924 [Cyanidiococcus yangmingshanensis]
MGSGTHRSASKRTRTRLVTDVGLDSSSLSLRALDDGAREKLAHKLQELLQEDRRSDDCHEGRQSIERGDRAPSESLSLDAQAQELRVQWKRVHRLARQHLGYRRLPDPAEDVELERRLAQTATRGTVQLFNLIHERRAAEAKQQDEKEAARRARLWQTREASLQASLSAPMATQDPSSACGWSAFSERFLLADEDQDSGSLAALSEDCATEPEFLEDTSS